MTNRAMRWLEARVSYERSGASLRWQRMRNLGRIRRLLSAVGNPERWGDGDPAANSVARPSRILHVAGTKGKGSTAHLLAGALRALGFRVGLYTSPHLVDLRERIQVDGEPIAERRLAAHLGRLRRAADAPALRREPPTYFDFLTAAAFMEFRDRGVDWAVVETGLGGRLDSTNATRPAVSILTAIDYDHTEVLGRTLGAIAREKAGIVKPGVPVLSAAQRPAAGRVVSAAARRAGAPLWRVGREIRLGPVACRGLSASRFDARTPARRWRSVRIALPGRHQVDNALLVLAALDRLERDGRLAVDVGRVRRALARVRVPGRLETIPGRPPLWLDVAHNPVAARAVCETLKREEGRETREEWRGKREERRGKRGRASRRRVLLFAAAREKDARAMLRSFARVTEAAVMVRVDHPRLRPLPDLLALARGLWPSPPVGAATPAEGLRLAEALAGPEGGVLVAGSFYLAGAVRAVRRP
jgi:dihydrofolate synthase/folylpolyglutamate synthase